MLGRRAGVRAVFLAKHPELAWRGYAETYAATANVEIISTSSETEALLLEANLIKQHVRCLLQSTL